MGLVAGSKRKIKVSTALKICIYHISCYNIQILQKVSDTLSYKDDQQQRQKLHHLSTQNHFSLQCL